MGAGRESGFFVSVIASIIASATWSACNLHGHPPMSARPRLIRISLGVSAGWLGISMIGDGVPSLLLPHRLLDAGATDATTLGITTLIGIGLAAAVQPVAGAWSDRIGRFRVVAIGTGLAATGLLILVSTSAMLAGAVLALVGASVAQAGYQPMLPDRVPVRWRGRAGGLKGAFDVGGAMLGFVLLGGLLGSGRAVAAGPVLIAALAAGFAISAILLGRASPPMPRVERRAPSTGPLLRVVAARFLFLLGIYAVGRFLVMYAAARFGLSADAAAADSRWSASRSPLRGSG